MAKKQEKGRKERGKQSEDKNLNVNGRNEDRNLNVNGRNDGKKKTEG